MNLKIPIPFDWWMHNNFIGSTHINCFVSILYSAYVQNFSFIVCSLLMEKFYTNRIYKQFLTKQKSCAKYRFTQNHCRKWKFLERSLAWNNSIELKLLLKWNRWKDGNVFFQNYLILKNFACIVQHSIVKCKCHSFDRKF